MGMHIKNFSVKKYLKYARHGSNQIIDNFFCKMLLIDFYVPLIIGIPTIPLKNITLMYPIGGCA
jgi:hypothetical protein